LRAEQTVGAKRAFLVGEALRHCGIKWSSGVICLAIADHLKELVALIALLSTQGKTEGARAALLAASCAVMAARDSEDTELAKLQVMVREALSEDNVGAPKMVLNAWEALLKKAGKYGRLFQLVPLSLRDAFASARLEDPISRRRRVFEDLRRWAILSAQDDPHTLALIEPRFSCRARLDQESTNLRDQLYKRMIYGLNQASDVDIGEVLAADYVEPRKYLRKNSSTLMTSGQRAYSNRRNTTKGENKK
ncbi:MAG: hypothetical protein WB644_10400, partial [Candidatus Cybelea sp.]